MRRFMIIFSMVIGFGLLFGLGQSIWTHILALIIMLIGVLYMFTGRVLPQFVETFLILLFVPLFVIFLFNLIKQFFGSGGLNPQINIPLWPFIVGAFLLSFLAAFYVFRIRRQNQRLGSSENQGSEREPVVPNRPT